MSRAVFLSLLFLFSCVPSAKIVRPKPSYFSDLNYTLAREKYRKTVEEKFREKDLSYILSLLSYGITCFYDRQIDDAKKAFLAAYKVDAGERPEAAKIYDWLVVDSRTVYKLKKRERELVHFYLGLCYLFQDNLEEALVEFKKLRQFDQDASKLPIVNFFLGFIYEKMGKFDDALIEYRPLEEMLGSLGLVHYLELMRDSGLVLPADSLELVVQVEHQTIAALGKTDIYIDDIGPVATLPENCDNFNVLLTPAEANRQAAQEAAAKATRIGLRLLGWILLDKATKGKGKKLSEEVADILLGKEEENRDIRAWGYAPLNFSFTRLRIPAASQQVRLVFHNQNGDMIGFCDYPLQGEKARAIFATKTYFIIAGLAEEFYVY
ncbi:MAG: hypothetical protein ABIK23_08005 [candidate division WOR-3 bacterium]